MTRIQKARTRQGPPPTPPTGPPIKHAGRLRIFIGLAIVITAFTAFVTPGFAEFESGGTENKGKGEIYEATITEGPTTITCAAEESASNVIWTVGNKEKKSNKILFNIEKLGTCTYVAAGGQEGSAKIFECEMETTQTGEQAEQPVKIIGCKIDVAECEIKIESQESKLLEGRETGESNENIGINFSLENLKASVSKACGPFGIQASKAVSMTGGGEMLGVKTAALPRKFNLTGGNILAGTESGMETQVFEFEKEIVTCPEAKYEYGPITGTIKTLVVKPILMQAGKPCKAKNIGNGTEANEVITITGGGGCELKYEVDYRIKSEIFFGKFAFANGCELTFKGSTKREECERKIGTDAKRLATLYSGEFFTDLVLEPKTTISWTTTNGNKCGVAETNGAHTHVGKYNGKATIPGLKVLPK